MSKTLRLDTERLWKDIERETSKNGDDKKRVVDNFLNYIIRLATELQKVGKLNTKKKQSGIQKRLREEIGITKKDINYIRKMSFIFKGIPVDAGLLSDLVLIASISDKTQDNLIEYKNYTPKILQILEHYQIK